MELLQNILELDKELFLYLNSFYNDFMDTIMLMVTRKETWVPFYLTIVFFFVKNYRSKSLMILLFMGLTIVLSDQVSVLLKVTLQRLRPTHEPALEGMIHVVFQKGGLYGFVSSHASNMFAVFAFTSCIFKNRSYYVLLLFWALLVSYSRIYIGVHYPLDVICGALLGWLLGVLMFKVLMLVENHFFIARTPKISKTNLSLRDARSMYLVFVILAMSVVIMTYILHHFNYL